MKLLKYRKLDAEYAGASKGMGIHMKNLAHSFWYRRVITLCTIVALAQALDV